MGTMTVTMLCVMFGAGGCLLSTGTSALLVEEQAQDTPLVPDD